MTSDSRAQRLVDEFEQAASCDDEGRCWYGAPDRPGAVACWDLECEAATDDTHWLPANALPTPEAKWSRSPGVTDESTPVGEAWNVILRYIHNPTPTPVAKGLTDDELGLSLSQREQLLEGLSHCFSRTSAHEYLKVWNRDYRAGLARRGQP